MNDEYSKEPDRIISEMLQQRKEKEDLEAAKLKANMDSALDQPEKSRWEEMRSDLRGWGIGLIIIGLLQYFLPFLDSFWAFIAVPMGVISLFVTHRAMFIGIGAGLIVLGIMNIFGGGFGFWTFYGGAQIYWGVQEIRKFGKYSGAEQFHLPDPGEVIN